MDLVQQAGILRDRHLETARRASNYQLKARKARKAYQTATAAQEIIQTAAERTQTYVHRRIAGIVTRCLETVFDQPYHFRIDFTKKRGKTEAKLVFVRNGEDMSAKDVGGGVVDVAAFALRLASLMLVKPPARRVLFLDEPFRFVSVNYQNRVQDMITALAEELDVQFILITHEDELRIGKVVQI